MATNDDFDWLSVTAMLEEIAPRVLRNFPPYIARDVDDIVQETLLKLHRSGYSEEPSRPLLAVMIKHQAIDRMRVSKRVAPLHDLVLALPDDQAPEHDRREALWEQLKSALDRLSREDRLLLMKFYRARVKIQNLADEAGVEYSAMAVRLYRIKKKLREELDRSK